MEISHLVQTPEGMVHFKATLSNAQMRALLEYALSDMIVKGFVPFTSEEDVDPHLVVAVEHPPQ